MTRGRDLSPADIRERTRADYDALARTYFDRFRDELEDKPYDRAVFERFARRLGPGARVCDAGCSPCGHVDRLLADAGLEVVGIDISAACIALANAAQPGLRFEVMGMEEMSFADDSFDGVLAYYSVPYPPRAGPPALGREFHRVLRPGGMLLVVGKEGSGESFIADPMGSEHEIFFAHYPQTEIEE